MTVNLAQDWPVYLLLGAFIAFVIFAFHNSLQQEKKNKAAQDKENGKSKV
jgi:hypothetical protein